MEANYSGANIQSEQSAVGCEGGQAKFMEDQGKQMLTLIDIINAFAVENNILKKENSNLQNTVCTLQRNCIDQSSYNNQINQVHNYLNFQNIIFIVMLILLILILLFIFRKI
jgi:hypothetical protein